MENWLIPKRYKEDEKSPDLKIVICKYCNVLAVYRMTNKGMVLLREEFDYKVDYLSTYD